MSKPYSGYIRGKVLALIAWNDYGLKRAFWGLEPDAWLRARCRQVVHNRPATHAAILLSWLLRQWTFGIIWRWKHRSRRVHKPYS